MMNRHIGLTLLALLNLGFLLDASALASKKGPRRKFVVKCFKSLHKPVPGIKTDPNEKKGYKKYCACLFKNAFAKSNKKFTRKDLANIPKDKLEAYVTASTAQKPQAASDLKKSLNKEMVEALHASEPSCLKQMW